MSGPKRSVYSGPALSGPGIFYSASKITNQERLSDELFNKWYNEVHCPDVLTSGTVTAAYRFRNANPAADRPYLAVYICPDLSVIQGDKMKNVPMTSDILPHGKSIHELAHFDTRFYSLAQEFVKTEQKDSLSPALLAAGMEPVEGEAEDMDRWYREEHLEQMSKEPGWRRSRRYNLVFQVKNEHDPSTTGDATSFLTLYEFDETNKLGMNVEPLDPMTEWTMKIIKNQKKIEGGVYKMIKSFP